MNDFRVVKPLRKPGALTLKNWVRWGERYGLKREWIDMRDDYPHFDLFGEHEREILVKEGLSAQLKRFDLL